MANTTIIIGPYTLPPCSKYSEIEIPQYAEFVSLNGIVWRDRRATEPQWLITLSWEALSPSEKTLVDGAWAAILSATPSSHTQYIGFVEAPFTILPDEKSNDYNYTGYMGAVQGTGFTTLYDATLIFRAVRVFV